MRYLIIFSDGETQTIKGPNLEEALVFAILYGHADEDVVAVFKLND